MKFLLFIFIIFSIIQGLCKSQELIWTEPVNLNSLNTKNDDFAPVWNRFQEQLYFNSNSSGFSKFYFSIPDANLNFTNYKLVEGDINEPRNNQSYITFETNEIAYLSSFRKYPERSNMNIFQTRKKKNAWLKSFDVDSLIYQVFMGHPTVSPDGSILIFSSTLNSEFGDLDLWMAIKQENGSWGSLIQISSLKTPGNEITPFLASIDTLYFASDGQEGPGGYDLFMSVRKDGIWQMPYPLNSLNTEFDETDFTTLPYGRAVFASNRPGGLGALDLYMTSLGKDIKIEQPITNIDFSIAAQVPDIKIKADINSNYLPLFNYFFCETTQLLNSDLKFIDNLTTNNPDSIHYYSPYIISQRIRELKEHRLFITIFSDLLNEVQQKAISEKILKSLNLTENRVNINYSQLDIRQKAIFGENISFIKFTTNNEKVFSTIDISEYKIEVIPPALELMIDARPRNFIKNWECKLTFGNNNENSIKSGAELPSKFFHDIKYNTQELIHSDSLVIKIYATDTLEKKYEYSQIFNITHSNSYRDNFVLQKNKKYQEFFILLTDFRELRDGNNYQNTFRWIVEKSLDKKNIIINCYSDYGKSMANSIVEYLKEQVGGNNINYKIENEIKKDKFSNKPYSKFLLSILVEIE